MAEQIAKEAHVGRDKAREALAVLQTSPDELEKVIAGKKSFAMYATTPR